MSCGARTTKLRGWRNTVDIVLFEISNSMKLYPCVLCIYTGNLKPVWLFEPQQFDEVSNRIPPTSQKQRMRSIACALVRARGPD